MLREFRVFVFSAALVFAPFARAATGEVDVRRDATVEVVEKVIPAVVNISSKTVIERKGYFFDWWRDNWAPFSQTLPPQYSAGSGVIIDEEGWVLTNVHVVEQATEVTVKLHDGRTLRADPIVGTRKTDVALLKLRGKPGEKFPYARLAADDDLFLGETVVAMGNPFGLGESVSKGILSSKSRRATAGEGPLDVEDWLQTDAAINPGNSGGPLVNLRGEIVGLNVAVFKEGQGIGFAIPVKRISESLGEIYTPEVVKGLWFGATFQPRGADVVVSAVESGSPAMEAGLRKNDVVVRVNNKAPRSAIAVNRELISAAEAHEVTFQVQRDGTRRNVTVQMASLASHFNAALIRERTGLTIEELTPQIAAHLRLENGGFAIMSVERGSPAEEASLRKGFVIEAIDDQMPDSVAAAARLIAKRKKGESIKVQVLAPAQLRRGVAQVRLR